MKYHKSTIKKVYEHDMDAAVYEVYDKDNLHRGTLAFMATQKSLSM